MGAPWAALPGARRSVLAFSSCFVLQSWFSIVIHFMAIAYYNLKLIESWWKLLLLMLRSEKLWFGGSCEQTRAGVKCNRKFTVVHNSVKLRSRRKTRIWSLICNRRGNFTQVLRISTGTVVWWASEQRPVVAFLFAVCFRKNSSKFLGTLLKLYFFFESQKGSERIARLGDKISCVVWAHF